MSGCKDIRPRKCGDMTYASYLARKCGKCESQQEKGKDETTMDTTVMEVTLSNGVTVKGTFSQIQAIARTFGIQAPFHGDGIHYHSSSKGLLKIKNMDDRHLRNAALKLYREWVNTLSTATDTELLKGLRAGPQDPTYLALASELMFRLIKSRNEVRR